jgi:hypothetical protein
MRLHQVAPPLPHVARQAAPLVALVALLVAACGSPPAAQPAANGQPVVPVDPNRPGDALFSDALTIYRRAASEQTAAIAARTVGDAATALSDFAASQADYGLARDAFDRLRNDPTLCPGVSIRCDNAAYLAGRCSYEQGMTASDRAALIPDATLLPVAEASLADAESRLDRMLSDFPTSAFVDSADYFDGRARFELTLRFAVGGYPSAEPFFAHAVAANPAGTWADNALYYDGRTEFEAGYGLVNAAVAAGTPLTPASADYAAARGWFDQAIAALASVPVRYPASSYVDNAAYYRGRAWFEKPTPGGTPDAERIANLGTAIDLLGTVVGMTSPFVPGAHYWRGRAHYALSFHRATQAEIDADLRLAIPDFHAVATTSPWRPHALEWAVKSWVRMADLPDACAEYAAMAAAWPLPNLYTSRAQTALTTWLTSSGLTCP